MKTGTIGKGYQTKPYFCHTLEVDFSYHMKKRVYFLRFL